MSEEEIKKQQGNQIAEAISSVKNCNNCPIQKTCDDYLSILEDSLCQSFKDKDGLNIID